MDVICPKCGEPWDAYGITYAKGEGSLTLDEVQRFLRGDGCPSCGFGTTCPKCHGMGIEKNGCRTCFGHGYVFAKRCPGARDARFRQWFIGSESSKKYPLRSLEEVEILRNEPSILSQWDGMVYVAKIRCPDCHGKGEPCSECGGDGKFHPEKQPDYFDPAVGALLDNSDDEPIGVLTEFLRGAPPRRWRRRKWKSI